MQIFGRELKKPEILAKIVVCPSLAILSYMSLQIASTKETSVAIMKVPV
jgi:hypothetical protein